MKGMPFPFDFEGKGVLDLDLLFTSSDLSKKECFSNNFLISAGTNNTTKSSCCFGEPTSVLETAKSCSTVSQDTNPSPKWPPQDSATTATSGVGGESELLLPVPPSLEKCAMEDWLSEGSPEQEQSIFRWILGEEKVLDLGGGGGGGGGGGSGVEYEFNGGGFGVVDQGNFMSPTVNFRSSNFLKLPLSNPQNVVGTTTTAPGTTPSVMFSSNNVGAVGGIGGGIGSGIGSIGIGNGNCNQTAFDSCGEIKQQAPMFNPQLLINQHQAQSPSFFMPQQGHEGLFVPPPAKRHNPGGQFQPPPHQSFPFLSPHFQHLQQQQRPVMMGEKRKLGGDDMASFQQQEIIDQLYKASEVVQTGNLAVLQGILARLNHQLSPIGKPFHRAAFYIKEALQLLTGTASNEGVAGANSSPFSLIFKIGAYKCFSEISPILQFANFTCTQGLIEEFEGFDRIHIVDFDIGVGGQWASLMQELALRPGGAPSLKITVLASPSTHDQLELGLTRENLVQFASEVNIVFEFDILSIDCLHSSTWPLNFHSMENEAVAVNLPIGCLSNYQMPVPLVFRFLKQLSPRIIMCMDRGCDRTDLPFSGHVIHALQSYTNLLESLDAVNVNMDALQKIEKFVVQPGIEKIVMGRFRHPEKAQQHWRTLFLSSGFSPVTFSNFTESQAEFVVKRIPVRGFQVEKRQSSLVLSFQQKELISVSAWRCSV